MSTDAQDEAPGFERIPPEPEFIDLAEPVDPTPSAEAAEAPAVASAAAEPILAEPGMYWCEQDYSGSHPVLGGLIHQGECDLTMITNPEQLVAIHALVKAGVLMGPM